MLFRKEIYEPMKRMVDLKFPDQDVVDFIKTAYSLNGKIYGLPGYVKEGLEEIRGIKIFGKKASKHLENKLKDFSERICKSLLEDGIQQTDFGF